MNDHGARSHSVYGASSAHRFFRCPGSVELCRDIPDVSSPWALEGTQAHEMLEAALCGVDIEGDETMVGHVTDCALYVQGLLLDTGREQVIVEKSFELQSGVAPGQVFGTNDVIIISEARRKMWVLDLKYGVEYVEVKGNEQLRFYGLGAYMALQPDIDTIELVIMQPRCPSADNGFRSEIIEPADLVEFYGELEAAILASKQPDAPLIPGAKQCRWCKGKVKCSAYEAMMLQLGHQNAVTAFAGVKGITPATLSAPPLMAPEKIADVLSKRKLMVDWFDEVNKYAKELLAADPNAIPGFKLVESEPHRKWAFGEEETANHLWVLSDSEIDPAEFYETSLMPLTRAEAKLIDHFKGQAKRGDKKAAAARVKEQMAFLTTKQSTGTISVVPLSDERPALNRAAQSFGGIELPKIDMAQKDS